jgi:hypothetical protein
MPRMKKSSMQSQSKSVSSTAQAPSPPSAPSATTSAAATTAGVAPTPLVQQAQPAGASTSLITSVSNADNTGTKIALQTSYAALVAGLQANYAPDDVFPTPTGNQTRDQLVATFQQFISAAETTKSSYSTWRGNVQTERQIEASVSPLRAVVRSTLDATYGKDSPYLLQYGFQPHKVGVRSAVSTMTAVVKNEATRKARGTTGKKQKLAISGNVTGVEVTPVTASGVAAPVVAAPASTTVVPAPAVKPAGATS